MNFSTHARVDSSYLKTLYDRCLDFDERKLDSVCYYASFIEKESLTLLFKKGRVLSLRLKGICHELQSDYEKAIDYYYQALEESRQLGEVAYEISALSDLAIAYSAVKRPNEAKKFYLQCATLALKTREIYTVTTSFNNLAVIYSQLGQYDSALIYLAEALRIGEEAEAHVDPSSTYNNIGNVYFKQKKYNMALEYFTRNYQEHKKNPDDVSKLWTDHINLADTYNELGRYDSAHFHAANAMELAIALGSKSKEADSYSMLARHYERLGNFSEAYQYLTKWYTLDTALVNTNIENTIAGLQERFHAKEREAQNILLMERVEKERYRNRSITYLALALALIGILIAIAFIIKRNANRRLTTKNKLIKRQYERLGEINQEKKSLIGIVSHDLGTPFATIQMWGQLLGNDGNNLSADQQKALQRIVQASNHGQQLIQRILDVEKSEIGNYKLQLEHFDLTEFIESITESFRPAAIGKKIKLYCETPGKAIVILSDKQLVHRMLENLVSNAIKYSPPERSVWITITDEGDEVQIKVRDEGVGINKDELPMLFSKYSKISSQPTAGETSTGLGLSIVKRIADELNGKVFCESEEGSGSLFTIVLKK